MSHGSDLMSRQSSVIRSHRGKDNQEYLDKTISGYPNTYGAIFLNVGNHKEMTDKNSIIYGHRMNSKSMFGKLEEYQEASFSISTLIFIFIRRMEKS